MRGFLLPRARGGLLVAALLVLVGCRSEPVCVRLEGSERPALKLSELQLFQEGQALSSPRPGVHEYAVRVPFYSDGAWKHRQIVLPEGGKLHAAPDFWSLPRGTLLVKTFTVPVDERDPSKGEHRIETRILQKLEEGYLAATYVWNEAQTDAVCSRGGMRVSVSTVGVDGAPHPRESWVAGGDTCTTCHGKTEKGQVAHALGWRSAQLEVRGPGEETASNQIDQWARLGLLDGPRPPPSTQLVDPFGSAPLEARARSYLDVNCGPCHVPSGAAAYTDLFLGAEVQGPGALGIDRRGLTVAGLNTIIRPGHPEYSTLVARMQTDNPSLRMPAGPYLSHDQAGIALLSEWIASLGQSQGTRAP